MRDPLTDLTAWADALQAGRPVEVRLCASLTLSIGLDRIQVNAPRSVGQVTEEAVCALLAVLQLRDLARGRSPQPPPSSNDHPAGPHKAGLDCPIHCLGLSKHAYNPLVHGWRDRKPATVRDVVALDEGDLRSCTNLGPVRIHEIKTKLADAGFRLGHHHGPGSRGSR